MIDFSTVKSITIPEGKVKRILSGDTVLWEAQTSLLPSAYQQVEYITGPQSTQAYIDLGFAFDTAATIKLSYYHDTGGIQIFGAAENSGKLRCMLSASGSDMLAYGSTGSAYFSIGNNATPNAINSIDFTLQAGLAQVVNSTSGDTDSKTTQGTYTMTNNLYLFAQNYNGTLRCAGTRQISAFRYYDQNDVLICDLVPCYRKSDGVIGMYDLARSIFLTSAGSGSFTKGADV